MKNKGQDIVCVYILVKWSIFFRNLCEWSTCFLLSSVMIIEYHYLSLYIIFYKFFKKLAQTMFIMWISFFVNCCSMGEGKCRKMPREHRTHFSVFTNFFDWKKNYLLKLNAFSSLLCLYWQKIVWTVLVFVCSTSNETWKIINHCIYYYEVLVQGCKMRSRTYTARPNTWSVQTVFAAT